jgi:hypothetical protein
MTNEEMTLEIAELKKVILTFPSMVEALAEAQSDNATGLITAVQHLSGVVKARVAVSDALVIALLKSKDVNPQIFEVALKAQIESQSADLAEGEKHNFETSIINTRVWIDGLK